MTTDPDAALVSALEHFLQDAKAAVDEQLRRDEPLPPTSRMLAASLAELPAGREADAAAHRAAVANHYEVTSAPRRRRRSDNATGTPAHPSTNPEPSSETAEPCGRPLDAEALLTTGAFGLLQSRAPHDFHAVAEQLADYLAGPPVGIWDYAVLDGNLTTDNPIPVIDNWELVTPSTEELRRLLPLPATANYQPNQPFKPQDYSGLTMLRRRREELPHHGPLLRFDVLGSIALDRRAHLLWRPLLLLSLFENPVLQLWARYQVEPGRRIDKLFDDVEWEVRALDADTDFEQPRTGDFGESANLPTLRRFLFELAPQMPEDPSHQANRQEDKPTARLRRSTEHLLTAGHRAHGEGEVLSELNAETVLHYVIALEGLLAGGESDHSDLTRKVSQRAAILAGEDDAQRLEIEQLVRDAYGARSKYAHGDTPRQAIDLPKLRRVVRRCLLVRLVIGDPVAEVPLHKVADQALLSHEMQEHCIRQPVDEFTRHVRG
jgi:Apea-like HEPN